VGARRVSTGAIVFMQTLPTLLLGDAR
jgi:hypothetical protein